MEEKIYVKNAESEKEFNLIIQYMNNSDVFFGKQIRFGKSAYGLAIYKDDEMIGFLNLIHEIPSNNNILLLDILLDEKYRGRGYASLAYKNFKNRANANEFIIAETKNNNEGANNFLSSNGVKIYDFPEMDLVYYLLDKSRLEEFLSSPDYVQFESWVHRERMDDEE